MGSGTQCRWAILHPYVIYQSLEKSIPIHWLSVNFNTNRQMSDRYSTQAGYPTKVLWLSRTDGVPTHRLTFTKMSKCLNFESLLLGKGFHRLPKLLLINSTQEIQLICWKGNINLHTWQHMKTRKLDFGFDYRNSS